MGLGNILFVSDFNKQNPRLVLNSMDSRYDTPQTPRRRQAVDRYVPHREGVNLSAAFAANTVRSPERADHNRRDPTDLKEIQAQEARNVYENVLKLELFGGDAPLRSSNSSKSLQMSAQSLGSTSDIAGGRPTPGLSTFPSRSSNDLYGDMNGNLSPSHSMNSIRSSHSNSSLSLPPSPRKNMSPSSSNNNLFRYSPKKLIRSESDLSDIKMGGGIVTAGGAGLGANLRPESRDYLMLSQPQQRTFRQTPVKTLDAPGLTKNFYYNVLEWGPGSKIAVALQNYVYYWDHETSQTFEIANLGNDVATSVSWMNSNEHLAVGTNSGRVHIYDVVTGKRLRSMDGHNLRVSSLAWNDYILSSGSQDCTILHRDCRIKDHFISRLEGHMGEVCGLKWNVELQQLASGGNDNKLKVWHGVTTATSQSPLYEFDEHTAAVKGVAWSPHQRGLLASGGGYCDQSIRFWNTLNGKLIDSVNTGSQVCNLVWNPKVKELVSSQGNSYNDVVVWQYPDMRPLTRLRAHGSRALHLSMSPGGDTLVTGSGDETMRLWSLFDDVKVDRGKSFLSKYGQLR